MDEGRCSRSILGLVIGHDAAIQKYFRRKHRRYAKRCTDNDCGEERERSRLRDTPHIPSAHGHIERPGEPRLQRESNKEAGDEEQEDAERGSRHIEHEECRKVYGGETEGCRIERVRHILCPRDERATGRPQERENEHDPGKNPNDTRCDERRRDGTDPDGKVGVPENRLIDARRLIEAPFAGKGIGPRAEKERGRLGERRSSYIHSPLP